MSLTPESAAPSVSPSFSISNSTALSALTMEVPDNTDDFTVVEGAIFTTDYARRCKELMSLHSALTSLGAGSVIDLPKIVVIGGQSAGKSSLVEAVSGISVPRDAGTCTRCPMECTMGPSSDERWYCDITLRYEYDDIGIRLGSPKTEVFCPRIQKKGEVDLWLRRAQMAMLSPHKPHQDFTQMSQDDLRYVSGSDSRVRKFSRNTICVDIKDPEATNLSFLDLPGLIQNETEASIKLVKNLVEENIGGLKSDNTLILVAIPMTDDMENQQAVLLARNADPQGLRTIGVLTKPDMLPAGATNARRKWKDILEGNLPQHSLKLGYYCVRLSDDDERARNISRSEAQALSDEFFETTPPWCQLLDQARFGIPSFVNSMSALLVDMIEKNLPKMREDVAAQLNKHRRELLTLPLPATNDPSTEILLRVTKFCAGLSGAVAGDTHKDLAQRNRALYHDFKLSVRKTAPDFRPFDDHRKYSSPSYPDEDGEQVSESSSANADGTGPLDLSYVRSVIKRSITWELPDHVPFDATKSLILQFTTLWRAPVVACFEAVFTNLSKIVDLLLNTHFKTYKQLLSHVGNIVNAEIQACKADTLKILEKMLAFEQVPIFTQNTHYLEEKGRLWLKRYCRVQQDRDDYWEAPKPVPPPAPVTVSAKPSDASRPSSPPTPVVSGLGAAAGWGHSARLGQWGVDHPAPGKKAKKAKSMKSSDYIEEPPLSVYEYCSPPAPAPVPLPDVISHEEDAIRSLRSAGYKDMSIEALAPALIPRAYREKLVIMSKVRAYFHVAYKRIIDYVPLAIEHELNQSLATRLQESLFKDLVKESKKRLFELLSEDPGITTRRKFLQGRVETLTEMQDRLASFRRDSVM